MFSGESRKFIAIFRQESECIYIPSKNTILLFTQTEIKALKILMEDDPEDFFPPYNDTVLNYKTLVPHQGGSKVSVSDS